MKTFIDCSNPRGAYNTYKIWRRAGYGRDTARRMIQAEFERDPEIAMLAMHWVRNNTNQGRVIAFARLT